MKRSFILVSSVASLLALAPGCEHADSPPSEEDVGEAQQAVCDASNLQPFIQDIPEQTGSSWLGISAGEGFLGCPPNTGDDTCLIQSAIDSLLDLNTVLPADPSPKTVLYLRQGTYRISRPLRVHGFGISLIGAGAGKSVIEWVGGAAYGATSSGQYAWPDEDGAGDNPPYANPCTTDTTTVNTDCCNLHPSDYYCSYFLGMDPVCSATPLRCDDMLQLYPNGHALPALASAMIVMDGTNNVRVSRIGLDGKGVAETAIRVLRRPYEDSTPVGNRFSGTAMSFTDMKIRDVQKGIWVGAYSQGNNDMSHVARVQFTNVGAARALDGDEYQDGAIVLSGQEALGWSISDSLFDGCSIGVSQIWGASATAWGNRFVGSTVSDFKTRRGSPLTVRSNHSTGSARFLVAPHPGPAENGDTELIVMDNTVISTAASTGTDYNAGLINVQALGNTFISGNTFVTQALPVIVTAGENLLGRRTLDCPENVPYTFTGCGLQLIDNVFQTPTPTAGELVTVSSDSPLPAAWAWAFTYNPVAALAVSTCDGHANIAPHITTFDNVAAPPGFETPALPLPVFTNVAPASTPVFQISPESNPACTALGLDMTDCIQKAFDDAVAWAADPAQNPTQIRPFVHIAAGFYDIERTLHVHSQASNAAPSPGIAIVGDGANTRLFWKGVDAATSGPIDGDVLDFDSPARVTLSDLMIQGRLGAPPPIASTTPSAPPTNQGRGIAIHVPDVSGSRVYADMLHSNLDAGNSTIAPGSMNIRMLDLDTAETRLDALALGGAETGVQVVGYLGDSAGVQINGGGAAVLPRVYSVAQGGKIVTLGARVEGAESNPLGASTGTLSIVGGTYLSQMRLDKGQPTIDSVRLAPYFSQPEIDATTFAGDFALIGAESNLPVLTGPQGRGLTIGQLIANEDNPFAPYLRAGLVTENPVVDCAYEMPNSGEPNAIMLASRIVDSTIKALDCEDRAPLLDNTAFIREVTAHARDAGPERLVSSCTNAVGDVRIHRVFVLMAGSNNGVTVSP